MRLSKRSCKGSIGKKGKKAAAASSEKDVAEVARSRHLDVFDHVGVGLAAFDDAID
jgi:hypothetical protein